jgi:hypothetical protein
MATKKKVVVQLAAIRPKFNYDFAGCSHAVYHANLNEGLPKHEHVFDHATICHAGSIIVRKEGKEYTFDKNSQPVLLAAAEWHEIEALEDGTVFENVFSIDNKGY